MVTVPVNSRVWEASTTIIEPRLEEEFDIALRALRCVLLERCNIVVILPLIAHRNVSIPPYYAP